MLHLIFEGNQELNNRTFPLAKGIRKHLQHTLDNYTGDKTIDGYKRLNNLLNMDSISYHEMKRIKNFFDNYKGTPKSTEFILNGGEQMMNWVNNTLNTATKAVHDFKQAKKDAGISNAFIKPHDKQRQIRKDKPTIAKIQSKDVARKLGDNNAIRFENKSRKIIYISEQVYRELIRENKRYNVNLDIKPAKEGRSAAKITPAEFENKLREIWDKHQDKYSGKFSINNFVYRFCRPYSKIPELKQLHDDLKKVKFDFENCDSIGNEVKTTNGISYIMADAGGDWECPVLFFVYWDGSKFRGYVPIYGNAVNRKNNSAFAQGDEDREFLKTQNIPDDEIETAIGNISYDKNACLKDFKSRVKLTENIDEGWKNWAMAGALGAATMFGSPQNVSAQNINQQNDTTQAVTARNQNGGFNFGDVIRSKGKSENEIQQTAKSINPGNIMIRNSRGEENNKIKKFLSTLQNVSKSMSTDSVKVFGSSDAKERMNYLNKFTEEMSKKYKMFFDSNENTFIMPVNYTLDDVKNELDKTFQLDDFDI